MTSPFQAAQLIDVEHLQHLSYERSKTWATFLDNIAESENQCEIPIDQLEEIFGQLSEEELDDLASMEDESYDDKSVDSEVLRDITNSRRLALMFAGGGGRNKTSKLPETPTNEENNELIDLFNQTLPVINEHNRQMKESGFDRILNTFDAKTIEEKVGGWLRRHNSLCVNHHTVKTEHNKLRETPRYTKKPKIHRSTRPYKSCYPEAETDSDDSFHSGETARYIRSSKAGSMKNSTSSTMMIKTYRMVKSTRQALRDKYACGQDDDADSHLDELRHRRRLAMHRHNDKYSSGRSLHKPPLYQYIAPSHSKHSQRRKILRKRTTSNSCSAVESSSESESYYYDEGVNYYHRKHSSCCNQHHCVRYGTAPLPPSTPFALTSAVKRSQYRALKNVPCSRSDRMCYYIQSHTHSMSSSSPPNSFTRTGAKKRLKRLDHNHSCDSRPCRRESECRCCNEKQLCKEYKHLADTSTEEWFVENCYSPRKPQVEQSVKVDKQQMVKLKLKSSTISSQRLEEEEEDEPSPPKKARKKTTAVPKPSNKILKKEKLLKKGKKEKKSQPADEDSFEIELQKALKLSEELFEKEQREQLRTQKQIENNEVTTDLSRVAAMKEDQIVVKPAEVSLNTSTKNRSNASIAGSENTFFAFSKPIYNSTTVESEKRIEPSMVKSKPELEENTEPAIIVGKLKGISILPTKVKRKKPSAISLSEETNTLKLQTNTLGNELEAAIEIIDLNSDDDEDADNVGNKKLKTQNETMPKEDKEQALSVEQRSEDHVFVKPQARLKVAVTTKNVSNVGTETTFFDTSQTMVCNSTAKVGQIQARHRQQSNNDQNDLGNDETMQSERPKIAVQTKNVSNVETETSSLSNTSYRQVRQRQQQTNVFGQEGFNNKKNKIQKKDKKMKTTNRTNDEMVTLVDLNETEVSKEHKNDVVIEANVANSVKDSTSDLNKSKQTEKENYEHELEWQIGNERVPPVHAKETHRSKDDKDTSISRHIIKKQLTLNPKKFYKKEEFGKKDSSEIINAEWEKSELVLIGNRKKQKENLERRGSTDISKKQQTTNPKIFEDNKESDDATFREIKRTASETNEVQEISKATPLQHSKGTKATENVRERSNSTDKHNKKQARHGKKADEKDDFESDNRGATKLKKVQKQENVAKTTLKKTASVESKQQKNHFVAEPHRKDKEENLNAIKHQNTFLDKKGVELTPKEYSFEQVPLNELKNTLNRKHSTVVIDETASKTQTTKVNKTNNSSNVTSTTNMCSAKVVTTATRSRPENNRRVVIRYSSSEDDDENDCTVVTSTTNLDTLPESPLENLANSTKKHKILSVSSSASSSSQTLDTTKTSHLNTTRQNKTLPSHLHHPKKGILIYAPHNSSLAPAHSFSNNGGFFNITLEHLSTIIGQKPAAKFLKYYIGRRRFNSTSTIYFRPPSPGVLDTIDDSSSDSDEDDLECIGQYGDLYESFGSGGTSGQGGQHSCTR